MRIEWSEGAYADYDEILGYLVTEFGQQTASEFRSTPPLCAVCCWG